MSENNRLRTPCTMHGCMNTTRSTTLLCQRHRGAEAQKLAELRAQEVARRDRQRRPKPEFMSNAEVYERVVQLEAEAVRDFELVAPKLQVREPDFSIGLSERVVLVVAAVILSGIAAWTISRWDDQIEAGRAAVHAMKDAR